MNNDLTRRSPRLSYFDYSTPGAYFVTINARDKRNLFGRVRDGRSQPNELGRLILDHWYRLPEHFQLVELDEFIVMPNHVHGIVLIKWKAGKVGAASGPRTDEAQTPANTTRNTGSERIAGSAASADTHRPTLPAIINGFKSGVTRGYRQLNPQWSGSVWHRSFYDHVIRIEDDLHECRLYIRDNPGRWSLRR